MAISEFEPWVRINGQLQVYTTSNKNLGQTAPSAWKCPKTQFWGPLTENLNPLQGLQTLWPHHQKTHRTGQKTMYWFIMTCIELGVIGKKNSLPHWKARIWLSWLSNKIQDTPAKTGWSSERSAYSLQNYVCFSPLTSGLESFGHKSTPSDRPWIEAYCPNF